MESMRKDVDDRKPNVISIYNFPYIVFNIYLYIHLYLSHVAMIRESANDYDNSCQKICTFL